MSEAGPAGPPPRASTPWYLRIGFRLALIGVVLMLGAYVVLPRIHDLSLRLFGLPGLEQRMLSADVVEPAAAAFAGLDALSSELLRDSRQDSPGRWLPTASAAEALDRRLAPFSAAYAWLDADRQVVCASPALGLAKGELVGELHPVSETVGPRPGVVALDRVAMGVWRDGEFAGWLLVYPAGGAEGAQPEPVDWARRGNLVIRGAGAIDETNRSSNRVIHLVSFLLFAGIAVLVSAIVSRTVTRRVTGLARVAVGPVDDPRRLPGPFDESGDDEIATLAHAMNTMRGRVIELVADLERRDQERRRWIAQVSHDFRTPLTALIACLERAEVELSEAREGEARERLAIARLDAERLGVLTEDLLDIARLETEEDLVREPVPPGELVRKASRALAALAEQQGTEVEVAVTAGLPVVTADGRRLMRGLENLLRNALHHARRRVAVRAVGTPGRVRFEVRDDGPGLPVGPDGAVDLDALAGRRSRDDSAGLGLVVVRKVAEAHGGDLGAANLEGGGAVVWFEVPVG